MFMHYKWVKIEIANRRFLATRTFFQIWKSWPRYLGNGAQVLDFTLKKSEVQHPLDFTFFTVGLHFNKKWSPTVKKVKSNTRWTSLFLPLDFTFSTLSAVKSNVFFEKFKVKSNGKKSEVQQVLDFTFLPLDFTFYWSEVQR